MKTLGEVIRKARKNKKLTTSQLASLTELSQGYISNIENNKKIPSHEILRILSEVLELDYLDLTVLAGYYSKDDLVQIKYSEQYYNTLTDDDLEVMYNNLGRIQEINEFKSIMYPQLEDYLLTCSPFYVNGYKLTEEDKALLYKVALALFGEKEKSYPSNEQIEVEFNSIKENTTCEKKHSTKKK